ncbi:MAG: hypothetical protein FWG03_01905 [Clostridiales bacterium]|nr:hypothetical protein [Clostridiales bacterium]
MERLERLFVNREILLDLVLNRISVAGDSGSLAHTLFIGARGAGKTYLVQMAYHKAIENKNFGKLYTVSLLPEELYGIMSFGTLIKAIDEYREPKRTYSQEGDIVTVVFVENFGRILDMIGSEEQKRLRAYIERNRNLLLIATAQRLSEDSFDQAAPFYGFFDSIGLSAFSLEEITRMLVRKAEVDGDAGLATRLMERDIQARLAALAQVVGGLPRIWSMLSSGLSIDNLPDMISSMLEKLDQLTPLYQEMLWRLSANERKAVMALMDAGCAMTVKRLAEKTDIDQKSLATTLRLLAPGWVIQRGGCLMQYVDKRNTFYQLAEPLARIVTQVKGAKGRPIETIAEFIAAWVSLDGPDVSPMSDSVDMSDSPSCLLKEQLLKGMANTDYSVRQPEGIDEELISECLSVDEALAAMQKSCSSERILALPTPIANLVETQLSSKSCAYMRIELAFLAVQYGGPNEWLGRAVSAITSNQNEFSLRSDEEKSAQLIISCIRFLLGQAVAGLQTLGVALSAGERELTAAQWRILATTVDFPALTGYAKKGD